AAAEFAPFALVPAAAAAPGAVCAPAGDSATFCISPPLVVPDACARACACTSDAISRFRYSASSAGSLGFVTHVLESLFAPVSCSRRPFWLTNTYVPPFGADSRRVRYLLRSDVTYELPIAFDNAPRIKPSLIAGWVSF